MTCRFMMREEMLPKLMSSSRTGVEFHGYRKEMPCLPNELFRSIFVHISDPRDILAVKATCSFFYVEASAVYYHTLIIPKPVFWSVAYLRYFARHPQAALALQTLKIRLITNNPIHDQFRHHTEVLTTLLLEAHNLTHYEVWAGSKIEMEFVHEAPCPIKARFKLRVLKITRLDLPDHIRDFLSWQNKIEILELRARPPKHWDDRNPFSEREIRRRPNLLLNLRSFYCSSPTSQSFILAGCPNVFSLRVGRLEGSLAFKSVVIRHFGTDSLVGPWPDLMINFPNLQILSVTVHKQSDYRFLYSLPEVKRLSISFDKQMRIREGDLDDQVIKVFFGAPKLDEVDFVLPLVGWRFHRHQFAKQIPGRSEEKV